ncbi:hypothetical protein CASFOL_025275 [Castilleja foliolosa]|uniref:Gag protein n=1 Tax=Castilleja foliolosa TaxID=1961234 RepID=A0ABD3CTV7_9LAMI
MDPKETEPSNTKLIESSVSIDDDLNRKFALFLKNHQQQYQEQFIPLPNIEPKLDDKNYTFWACKIKLALGARGWMHHITGIPKPPLPTETNYPTWEKTNIQVISWLVDSMVPDLMGQFIEYQTARELWNGIYETYRSGEDALQIYDLHIQANRLFQGEQSLEKYYQSCQSIWRDIDRRDPNNMECANDIQKYNKKIQTFRLYQFIHGADSKFDAVKRDLLKEAPQPTVEMAYAALRREAARVLIINRPAASDDIGVGLAARNQKPYQNPKPTNTRPSTQPGPNTANPSSIEKSKLHCDHCQKKGHTKQGCFELIGYPDWFENNPKFHGKSKKGTAAVTTGPPQTIIGSQQGNGDEFGFAAYAGRSKQGGNVRETRIKPRQAAPGNKRPRPTDCTSRGGAKRPPAAATSTGAREEIVKKESDETLDANGLVKVGTPFEPKDEMDLFVQELQNMTGPKKSNGLSVPMGPSDMMGIEPEGFDGLDFLTNETAGPSSTADGPTDPTFFDDLPLKNPTEGHSDKEDHWAWH